MPVAQAQQRDDGEVRTGRVAADRQPSFVVLEQPERSRLAVVGACGIRMLGREPVVDADRRQPGRLRELPEVRVLHVGAADRPAAAVEVQVRASRLGRLEHAQRDLARRPGNGDRARLLEVDRARASAPPPARCASRVTFGGSSWSFGIPAINCSSCRLNVRVSARISSAVTPADYAAGS